MSIDEHDGVAIQFGVPPEQIERDHLISHLLAAISREFGDRLYFIGGTALARTHLVNGRLSEDIDLVALDNRKVLAAELDTALFQQRGSGLRCGRPWSHRPTHPPATTYTAGILRR
ncbi:nucleotidyl transferase AbiEii/AbiGii toxin family protein [Nocardia ninae]|uniref:Nucleotidyl transferase AbiEii/AbiGii toxin family protein n=1 Tax=Nocardia ninae NBRC 108245 TaxID=1210091 RepID=A0A511MIR7_9NOCA|nr:nucleotidyl transferase AbiEii/AbiGii toxin family protein [Nocardia ninae]GEM40544.1 hypothetical protein NN4_50630 [Nocardia ninae NBRC 108245]